MSCYTAREKSVVYTNKIANQQILIGKISELFRWAQGQCRKVRITVRDFCNKHPYTTTQMEECRQPLEDGKSKEQSFSESPERNATP